MVKLDCVYFQNLNQMSLKDNYPLPLIEKILQIVVSAYFFSMNDGFYIFNEIWVKDEDQ